MRKGVLAFVMAGGKGIRLGPMTNERAKPAVPFGGKYRIIDFALSNLVNSGITSIFVLTQFKCQSLIEHLSRAWQFGTGLPEFFVKAVPAQMRRGESWYNGTADAIFQNVHLIREREPDILAVFAGDHIYRMDIGQMIQFHVNTGAEITISAVPMPIETSRGNFGILEIDENQRAISFEEKPASPKEMPGQPGKCLVSMGNYLFERKALLDEIERDHVSHAIHDFGKSILPELINRRKVYVYNFLDNKIPGVTDTPEHGYWRDIGTIEAYYEANMDLKSVKPVFNLYNRHWPVRTSPHDGPPAKFVHDSEGRTGRGINSIISEGCIVSGALVRDSVIGRNVRANSYGEVVESVIFDGVEIGRGAKVHRAIIDKYAVIEPGDRVGFDLEADAKRFYVSPSGLVVIARQQKHDSHIARVTI